MLLMVSCFRLDCIRSGAVLFCMFLTEGNAKAFLTAQATPRVEDFLTVPLDDR